MEDAYNTHYGFLSAHTHGDFADLSPLANSKTRGYLLHTATNFAIRSLYLHAMFLEPELEGEHSKYLNFFILQIQRLVSEKAYDS